MATADLKTTYKDEVLQEGETYRKYNIVKDDQVIQQGVHLEPAYTPKQPGDSYGALDINQLNTIVNHMKNMGIFFKE